MRGGTGALRQVLSVIMPETPVRLSVTEVDASTTALKGEIDAHTAPTLVHHFETLPAGEGDFCLDMSGVEFMDSSGLRVIIELHQRAEADSRRLVLRAPSQAVGRLLEISGLTEHLNVD
jgi:anti-sigma B factor antagonist